ncbi:hypothetical protein GCM10022377_10830 [Zhihengliuella alba]|uniref:DUF2442 domain-containing protein n=1 Tax=Zhihengliuella alba TaxID=547018 RepID=A0ABP7D242_9MICC
MTVVFADRGAVCAHPAPGHALSTTQIVSVLEADRREWLPATVTSADRRTGRFTVQPASGAPFEAHHHDAAAVARFLPLGRGCLWNADLGVLIGPEIAVRARGLHREIVRRALSLAAAPLDACHAAPGAALGAGVEKSGPPPEDYPTAGGPTKAASADRCSPGSLISR